MTTLLDRSTEAAPQPPEPVRRQPVLPALRRGLDGLTVAALALLVAVTHAHRLAAGPGFGDDEGTYTAQAWAVQHLGQLAHYTYWYDHPPLGWLVIAGWNVTFGRLLHPATAVEGGRQLMVAVATATAVLLWVLGRRLGLHRWACTAAVVAWALSPLALSYSRMVYLDNIGILFLLGAFVLALTRRHHLWLYAGSGAMLAAAVLTKETLLLWAPAVVYAAYRSSAGRTRPFCLAAFGGTVLLVLAAYPLLALLKGELLPGAGHVSLVDALRFQLVGRASTGSPLSAGSGSAGLVRTWLHTDPYLLVAGVAASAVALAVARLRPVGLAVAVPVLVSLRPGYLPDPFVIGLLPFAALAAAGSVDAAVTRAGSLVGIRGSGPRAVMAGTATAVAVITLAAVAVLPQWRTGIQAVYDDTSNNNVVAAEDYLGAAVPHRDRVVVDDTMWVDLVRRGFNRHLGVIWFYKTDFTNNLDPSVARALPNGYRDLQYVVVTPVMRAALSDLPHGLQQLRLAIDHSTLLRTFGSGRSRIEVRRITTTAPSNS